MDSDKISRSEYEQLKTAMEMIQVLCHLSTTPSSFWFLSVHVCLSSSPLSCFTSSCVFFSFSVYGYLSSAPLSLSASSSKHWAALLFTGKVYTGDARQSRVDRQG